jgi:hypothetical protein
MTAIDRSNNTWLIIVRYGGNQIANGSYDLFQFFVCFGAVIFGAQSAGTIFSFARALLSTLFHIDDHLYC